MLILLPKIICQWYQWNLGKACQTAPDQAVANKDWHGLENEGYGQMKKLKAILSMVVLGLSLVLLVAPTAGAYSFTYLNGGFFSQSAVPGLDGPESNWDSSFANSSAGSDTMYSNGYGQLLSSTPNSITVMVNSVAGSGSSSSYSAYSNNLTANSEGSPGIFFQVSGSPGDEVQINYFWQASISNYDGGPDTLSTLSGGSAPMFISLNGANVWHQDDPISVGTNSFPVFEENGSFSAQVGDIIGINLAAYANNDFSGEGDYLYSQAYNSLELEVVPLPPAVWLLGSGLLGLLARRGLRPRRR